MFPKHWTLARGVEDLAHGPGAREVGVSGQEQKYLFEKGRVAKNFFPSPELGERVRGVGLLLETPRLTSVSALELTVTTRILLGRHARYDVSRYVSLEVTRRCF